MCCKRKKNIFYKISIIPIETTDTLTFIHSVYILESVTELLKQVLDF